MHMRHRGWIVPIISQEPPAAKKRALPSSRRARAATKSPASRSDHLCGSDSSAGGSVTVPHFVFHIAQFILPPCEAICGTQLRFASLCLPQTMKSINMSRCLSDATGISDEDSDPRKSPPTRVRCPRDIPTLSRTGSTSRPISGWKFKFAAG